MPKSSPNRLENGYNNTFYDRYFTTIKKKLAQMHSATHIIKLFPILHYSARVENTNQAGFQYCFDLPCIFGKDHQRRTCSRDSLSPSVFSLVLLTSDTHWSLASISFFLQVGTMTWSLCELLFMRLLIRAITSFMTKRPQGRKNQEKSYPGPRAF